MIKQETGDTTEIKDVDDTTDDEGDKKPAAAKHIAREPVQGCKAKNVMHRYLHMRRSDT